MQNKPISIKMKSLPVKLNYGVFESVDTSGGVVEVTYEDGTASTLQLNESMITYDTSNIGTKTVQVKFGDGETQFEISVSKKESNIHCSTQHSCVVGDKFNLNVSSDSPSIISYKSTDISMVTVDEYGYVDAIREGKTIIKVDVAESEFYLPQTVEIYVYVSAPTLSVISKYQKPKKSVFKLKVKKTGSGKLSYKSNNKKVATVSSLGQVTTKKRGKAKITVFLKTNHYKTLKRVVTITVK